MDEQEQEQPMQVKSTPYQSPIHTLGSTILFLTSTDNELHKLELTFRGLTETDNEEVNIQTKAEPLMNEYGIKSVLGQAMALTNKLTMISNLSSKEISALMDFLCDTLARDLMMNSVSYQIKDRTTRDKIYFEVLSTTYTVLKSGHEGGYLRFLKGSQQEITMRTNPQPKKGMMAALGNWGK